jgi:2-phospho-L-lactate transferase/gluconeogenesis factor (CofD/UPF0052 family)
LKEEAADPKAGQCPLAATVAAVQVCAHLRDADVIVYGIGSLYTSILPSLILRGVGEAVADRDCPKVLLLNGCHDRETSLCLSHDGPMHAVRLLR